MAANDNPPKGNWRRWGSADHESGVVRRNRDPCDEDHIRRMAEFGPKNSRKESVMRGRKRDTEEELQERSSCGDMPRATDPIPNRV